MSSWPRTKEIPEELPWATEGMKNLRRDGWEDLMSVCSVSVKPNRNLAAELKQKVTAGRKIVVVRATLKSWRGMQMGMFALPWASGLPFFTTRSVTTSFLGYFIQAPP